MFLSAIYKCIIYSQFTLIQKNIALFYLTDKKTLFLFLCKNTPKN